MAMLGCVAWYGAGDQEMAAVSWFVALGAFIVYVAVPRDD
jgi:hypothetical protein